MLGFEIKVVFEPGGPGNGELCSKCCQEIKGQKYQGILQFGFIEQLNLKPLNLFLCETCKIKQDLKPG